MADIALSMQSVSATAPSSRAKALDRMRMGDIGFRLLTRLSAITVLVLLGGVYLIYITP